MRIMVINPNTSSGMTHHIRLELEEVRAPTTQLTVVNPDHGPESIVERELGVPVLDPTVVALKMAELFASLGLKPSKRGLYASPRVKVFK